ncbi:hypothetical protein OG394_21530 [Kribbella sp. NBC_01245]|uniref:hypothetical protein n=1 Tax=Kribbella sp. NBC_01245 TaxID=2903578 RepID=UPI002E27D899|nr:hypothetical protein [Kribbella sp. NBC_01245]
MASDLERIAQGLLDYLDQNPRLSADLRNAAGQCMELAAVAGELSVLLPEAAAVAEHLAAAAHACDEAAALSANATTIGRTWAISAVGGGTGPSPAGTADRNPATTLNRPADREERDERADEERDRFLAERDERDKLPESEEQDDRPAERGALPTPLDLPLPEGTPPPVIALDPTASDDPPATEQPDDKQPEPEPEEQKPFNLDVKFGEGDDAPTARDILKRYDPAKANLPELTLAEAVDYITANKDARPWLAPAADCEPEVQRVYATLDNGLGHAHHRHNGLGEDTLYERRVTYLEDPAQTDPTKRTKSEDAFRPGDLHFCGIDSTRIASPRAFATAFVRALDNEELSLALQRDWDETTEPFSLKLPISDLLGPAGHEECIGYRLNGEWPASRRERKAWAVARARGQNLQNLPEPTGAPIQSFKDGDIEIRLRPNGAMTGYEIGTMFPNPAEPDS